MKKRLLNVCAVIVLNALSSAWGANTLKWTSGDPCVNEWEGVGCDATNTTVVSLYVQTFPSLQITYAA